MSDIFRGDTLSRNNKFTHSVNPSKHTKSYKNFFQPLTKNLKNPKNLNNLKYSKNHKIQIIPKIQKITKTQNAQKSQKS